MSARGVAPALERCAELGRAALIGYLPVGYPDVPTSIAAMQMLVEAGVDIVEIGVPYSDPLMDGPVIQHAVDAALRGGTRVRDTFTAVRGVVDAGAPALVMTYWNLVERHGVAATAHDLADVGGAGLITPDLIPDAFADVPAELLGSVEVYKNSTADLIEGGLSGTVNMNLRLPFDNRGFHIGYDIEANYGDFRKKWSPVGSLLVSNTWDTGIGRIGLLGAVSYSKIYTRSDGVQVSNFQTRDGTYAITANTTDPRNVTCRTPLPGRTRRAPGRPRVRGR